MALALTPAAMATEVTNANDDMRTGWYPDESALSPSVVSSNTFGRLWSASVNGQVYAQPLLSTATATLVVATENDKVYGLNPTTGAQNWMNDLGTPWNPGDVGCGDITPAIGTTATPVIDNSTNTVYLTHKTYASGTSGPAAWYMDALSISTGKELTGWPVQLSGSADNAPSITFTPTSQQQRPGLLLMNGVIYAGFGSHCDYSPYRGWVFGVSTTTHSIAARWTDNVTQNDGAGIWQSGVGLSSDGSGSILLNTGNGGAPGSPQPGSSVPATCGECVIRLNVQPNGSLKPVDFFAPYDAAQLDSFDSDFGSGGVVGLPSQYFGTSSVPHLAIAAGKEGVVYLLNRDNLGGFQQGSGGGDAVVQRIRQGGAVFGRAGVWPGDGGYIYVPTSTGTSGGNLDVYKYGVSGQGAPTFSYVTSATETLGFGSGSPVITSDGTTSGSALIWIIYANDRTGAGGQLRAYDPVPVSGHLNQRFSAPIGTATNYSTPGVADGKLFVGTRDGHVLAFGSPVTTPLSGSSLTFPATVDGQTSQSQTMTLTANEDLTISSIASSSSQFTLGTSTPTWPATLTSGQTISIPVTFAPTQTGPIAGQVDVTTTAGNVSFAVSGTGQAATPKLSVSPSFVSYGGTSVGSHLPGTVTFGNLGNSALTISKVNLPQAPFTVSGAPSPGDKIQPGSSITVNVSFDPTKEGTFSDAIGLNTDGGNMSIGLSGSASTPGTLQISSETNDYGSVTLGTTATKSFTVTNVGGTTVTIMKSKPPFGGEFAATTSLPEGTTIDPGQTVTETVAYTPTAEGPASTVWQINGDDTSGLHQVQFTGTGVTASTTTTTTTAPGSTTSTTSTTSSASGPPSHPPVKRLLAPTIIPGLTSVLSVGSVDISYVVTSAGVTRFALQRATVGRRNGRLCGPTTARNRHNRRCTYFVTVATFSHLDLVGSARLRLVSMVPARKLVPGKYRIRTAIADSAGVEHTFYTKLRITAAPRPRPRRR